MSKANLGLYRLLSRPRDIGACLIDERNSQLLIEGFISYTTNTIILGTLEVSILPLSYTR